MFDCCFTPSAWTGTGRLTVRFDGTRSTDSDGRVTTWQWNFGDGATSEGAFHEGANFAAVMRAPVVLLCNNNQWAISTPLSAQTAAETLADKAAGYGMPGVRVDGGDVLAVYEATREAVARARSGEGPSFIEAVTYRAAPHATADDPRAYIDLDRVEEEKKNECVGRYERYLKRLGGLDEAVAEQIRAEAADVTDEQADQRPKQGRYACGERPGDQPFGKVHPLDLEGRGIGPVAEHRREQIWKDEGKQHRVNRP